jgi:predicted transcriptional regulator
MQNERPRERRSEMMMRKDQDRKGAVSRGCIPASTTVYESKAIVSTSDEPAFVVLDGDTPMGVITAARLRSEPNSPRRTVADVMDYDVVAIDHGDDIVETMRAYDRAGWASLRRRQPFAPVGSAS